jgi:multiple sugar transport system permease protein
VARHAAGAVGDPAGHELPGLAVAVRPLLQRLELALALFGIGPVPWTGEADWAGSPSSWSMSGSGAPFFMIMYLAALKSVPEQLYEAAAIDGANWWQRMWYVTLPMMRNIMAITALFSLIVTFRQFRHRAHPHRRRADRPHPRIRTWAFWIGIQGNDIPLGASGLAVHGADPRPSPRCSSCATSIAGRGNVMTRGHRSRLTQRPRARQVRQHEPRSPLGVALVVCLPHLFAISS